MPANLTIGICFSQCHIRDSQAPWILPLWTREQYCATGGVWPLGVRSEHINQLDPSGPQVLLPSSHAGSHKQYPDCQLHQPSGWHKVEELTLGKVWQGTGGPLHQCQVNTLPVTDLLHKARQPARTENTNPLTHNWITMYYTISHSLLSFSHFHKFQQLRPVLLLNHDTQAKLWVALLLSLVVGIP